MSNETHDQQSVASDKRKVAKAAMMSMATAFGLVAANPHMQQNEVGEWSLAVGAETACAAAATEYRCVEMTNYNCQRVVNGVTEYYFSYILRAN